MWTPPPLFHTSGRGGEPKGSVYVVVGVTAVSANGGSGGSLGLFEARGAGADLQRTPDYH